MLQKYMSLFPGYILAGIFFFICIIIASISNTPSLNILVCMLSGGIGWGIGLALFSLTTSSNAKKFTQWLLAGFTGLSLGKLDDISSSKFITGIIPDTREQIETVILASTCLIIGVLVTAVWCNFKRRLDNIENRSKSIDKIKKLADTLR